MLVLPFIWTLLYVALRVVNIDEAMLCCDERFQASSSP